MSCWQFDTPLLLLKIVMPVDHGLFQYYIVGGCRTSSMNYVKNSIPFLGMWELQSQGFTEKLALVASKFARASMGINGKSTLLRNPWIWMSSPEFHAKKTDCSSKPMCMLMAIYSQKLHKSTQ